ncbi:23S rRNA (uracil(1939)-C(5))-methyltransferase RlmD, partial [Candidatus Sumerlaeota bacterium]|nr:23S rRNA (uracil(1939)-C(5))-methyltransferase RlmD [Candidatus Sumerlaeota bacterium]
VLQEIVRPSGKRIEAPCPIFGTCGGCSWQNLPYEEQLRWKERQVAETLAHIGGECLPDISPIIPSPEVWHYRNKMEFTFGMDGEGKPIVGFHHPGAFDRIFEVPRCLIHPEPFDAILKSLTEFAREKGLRAYDQRWHDGFLRHAVIRHSRTTGGVMTLLITHQGNLPDPEGLAARLKRDCPALQGFAWGINRGLADVASVEEKRFAWGDPILEERINGLSFKISPLSFFQTNTAGAEKLYARTVEMAQLEERDRVLDAYCGAGTIGLHSARKVSRVVGIELNRDAIWDARANAAANGITNATFIAAPMAEGMNLARHAAGGEFTRVIIDPPRGGMDKKSLATLIAAQAPVFIYVSCNPATLARDLKTICEGGYRVDAIQPVDMFPHTYHIETIVRFVRATNA